MEKNNCFETDDATDRISSLPDVLLVHILSFLSTKEAAETCILSKRWKSTWACVPVLDINLKEFRGHSYKEREAKFKRFVKGVLQNREPSNLEKFKLVWYSIECCTYINSKALDHCILQAIRFKPQVLSLSVCKQELFCFNTDPIFTCASLHDVVLKYLGNRYVEIAPSSVHIPCLKKLHLTHLKVDDDFTDKIFFGCPILEELFLHDCILDVYKISSSKLKKLVILDCCLKQSLEISTPDLLELEIRGCCCDICSLWETMASLITARIEFPALCYADVECKLLTGLSNIASLDLQLRNSQLRELLENEVLNFPIFNNLKTLILGRWCMSRYFELVAFFLRSPNLQRLTLYNYYDLQLLLWELEDDTEEKSSLEEARGVSFQREQLEIVKIIKSSENDEYVEQLVEKLHAHVKTIGKIIII